MVDLLRGMPTQSSNTPELPNFMKNALLVLTLGGVAMLSSCQTIDSTQIGINPDGTVSLTDATTGVTVIVPAFTPSK